jgi:hypothetical protein
MPGNAIALRQSEHTSLNVFADDDGLDIFHVVVRHLQ